MLRATTAGPVVTLAETALFDGRTAVLQVTDAAGDSVRVRVLVRQAGALAAAIKVLDDKIVHYGADRT